jgi:hypothetical protein
MTHDAQEKGTKVDKRKPKEERKGGKRAATRFEKRREEEERDDCLCSKGQLSATRCRSDKREQRSTSSET